jgi:beta-lactamase class D
MDKGNNYFCPLESFHFYTLESLPLPVFQHFKSMTIRSILLAAVLFITLGFVTSCRDSRIHEKPEIGEVFEQNGIANGCFIIRDHTHEEVFLYNRERCLKRFSPASTFKIFNSLVALETAVAPDEQFIIKWDSIVRPRSEWNHDMTLREAFKVSNVPYYQALAKKIGSDYMQHFLDTAQYGNRRMGGKLDEFWLNDTLQISADEQVGLMKRLYFDELPFSERSQRITRSIMLREDSSKHKVYYKTGTIGSKDSTLYWIVGFAENIVAVNEPEESMNKSGVRTYPYFFAMNFTVSNKENKDWGAIRINMLHELLRQMVFARK